MRSQGMRYPRQLAEGCVNQQTEVWPAQAVKAAIEALPQTLVRAPRVEGLPGAAAAPGAVLPRPAGPQTPEQPQLETRPSATTTTTTQRPALALP